jgi:hypothetical protein
MRSHPRKTSLKTELGVLLDWLCVKWGFCIPPDDADRIASSEHLDARTFAAEVIKAEGLNPEYEISYARDIRRRFVEHFGSEAVSARDYPSDK